MGIGGLHSTEANRSVVSDEDNRIVSVDVASYYPASIINLGLYPQAVGPRFTNVYKDIRDQRLVAKRRASEIKAELNELYKMLEEAEKGDG